MKMWKNNTNEESHPRMNTEESFLNSSRILKQKTAQTKNTKKGEKINNKRICNFLSNSI